MHSIPRRRWVAHFSLLGVLVGSVLLSVLTDFPHDSQHWTADLVTSIFSTRPNSHHESIVLVEVSDDTLTGPPYVPYVSPVDRALLEKLICAVDRAGAKVIGLDIILDRRTELNKDETLRRALHHTRAKIVVGAIHVPKTGSSIQSEFFLAKGDGKDPAIGHLYLDENPSSLLVSDHVIRFMKPEKPVDVPAVGEVRNSFAEALAQAAGADFRPGSRYIDWLLPPNYDKHHTPRSYFKSLFLASRKKGTPFLTIPAEFVLDSNNKDLSALFKNKIVIIGVNFFDRDQHLTPLSRDNFFTGSFIHAQILAQLLDNRSIRELSWPALFLAALIAGYGGYWIGLRDNLWLEFCSVTILVLVGVFAFCLVRVIFPFTPILIVLVAGTAVGHYRQARRRAS
jgi:CHASE2 domain-containing sensor protein